MRYMGSKNRHSKELLDIILKDRHNGQWYVEPFVGGFNIIDKVNGNRIASDINYYLIQLFLKIQGGWIPPSNISEEQYNDIRKNKVNYPPYLVGFVGFGCSYAGKWFGGYARSKNSKGIERNHCLESKNNILNQAEKIKGVLIYNLSYLDLKIPDNSIVYCDPPYENTTRYKCSFNHTEFWDWCRKMSINNNRVFISEYDAPDDFMCIWEKTVNNTLIKNTGAKQGTEKLFVYENRL